MNIRKTLCATALILVVASTGFARPIDDNLIFFRAGLSVLEMGGDFNGSNTVYSAMGDSAVLPRFPEGITMSGVGVTLSAKGWGLEGRYDFTNTFQSEWQSVRIDTSATRLLVNLVLMPISNRLLSFEFLAGLGFQTISMPNGGSSGYQSVDAEIQGVVGHAALRAGVYPFRRLGGQLRVGYSSMIVTNAIIGGREYEISEDISGGGPDVGLDVVFRF